MLVVRQIKINDTVNGAPPGCDTEQDKEKKQKVMLSSVFILYLLDALSVKEKKKELVESNEGVNSNLVLSRFDITID